MTTLAQQSDIFLSGLQNRRRSPVKPSTLAKYTSGIKNHIVPMIGFMDLLGVDNGTMKSFVNALVDKKLSPKSVLEASVLVKQIIRSAVDERGNELYPKAWNFRFIDLPPVVNQKQPTVTPEQLKAALADKQYGLFYALLAGTGMRVNEALGLRYGARGVRTGWSPNEALVDVRTGLWRNVEGSPKTLAAVRQVDLDPFLNGRLKAYVKDLGLSSTDEDYVFMSPAGSRLCESTLRKSLASLGIEGFHSFRRFRLTHLREQRVPEDLIKFWMGHAKIGVTDLYSHMSENVELRKTWAEKAGGWFPL